MTHDYELNAELIDTLLSLKRGCYTFLSHRSNEEEADFLQYKDNCIFILK